MKDDDISEEEAFRYAYHQGLLFALEELERRTIELNGNWFLAVRTMRMSSAAINARAAIAKAEGK